MPKPQSTIFIHHPSETEHDDLFRVVAKALRTGLLVAFPTETVYGLGANAFDAKAVAHIFRVKGRPGDNPLIVHVAGVAQALELAQSVPPCFDALAARFWPGPLTLVVRRNAAVPDVVAAGLPTVAIRMPAHPAALALIRAAGVPVAAPSANISGAPSPTTAEEVMHDLDGRIFAVIDGGPCREGIESTVLDITTARPRILRPGVVTREAIEAVLGVHVRIAKHTPAAPAAPGMKYLHYAPATPVRVVDDATRERIAARIARLARHGLRVGLMARTDWKGSGEHAFHGLGPGEAADYARNIYLGLRSLDRRSLDLILVPAIPATGLGLAVMNRLRKAAGEGRG